MQRALHLAADIAAEQDAEDFGALAERGLIDREVAARLGALVGKRLGEGDVTPDAIADVDVFLRSVEAGAPAPRLVLPPLGSAPKLPPGTQKTAINVSVTKQTDANTVDTANNVKKAVEDIQKRYPYLHFSSGI